MKAKDWFVTSKISFAIGIVWFFVSIIATLLDRTGGPYRDFGLVGLLVSTFIFIAAYISYQRYKIESNDEK